MDTTYTWTVDVEYDWGGRTSGNIGIKKGLPRILEVFRSNNIKALFFISTEILKEYRNEIYSIRDNGHEIGSHGHFHIRYKEDWRWQQDKEISELLLTPFKSVSQKTIPYRAPWFNRQECENIFSDRVNHVSILKYSWFGGKIPKTPIFYIHPFDVVQGVKPPSFYTRILYAAPDMVYDNFVHLCQLYPGNARLR